jgi:uncharacterized protein YlbG (UPF0298 family)
MNLYEIIGYIGSALIAISLLMSSIYKLRIINCIGSAIFSFYGFLIKSPSVFLLNAFLAVVNIYHIVMLKTKKDVFKFIKVNYNDKILEYFILYNYNDIKQFFPEFDTEQLPFTECFLIMRNLVPVGVFIYKNELYKAKILVDYVIKEYRDFKNAIAFFNSQEVKNQLSEIKEFYIETVNPKHIKYLKKVGFVEKEKNVYYKSLQ